MPTNETVSDIIGKDLAYEERTRKNTIVKTSIGTIAAGIGAANWGPENVPVKISNFESIFGTPLTRDDESKDYTGLAIYKALEVAPYAYFTRVADSSAQKASLTINKAATFATLKGEAKISGKNYAISSNDTTLGFRFKNGAYQEAKVTISPSESIKILGGTNGCASFVNIDVTTESKEGFSALNPGDLIKLEIDGILKQYVVQPGDLFARLLDSAAGYLYTQANGNIGASTPGIIDLQFKNAFPASLQDSAPSSLFDNRTIVSISGTKDISIDNITPGIYKMKFSMSIDDNNPQSLHNYSEVTIAIGHDAFVNAASLAQAMTGLLVQAYTNSGDILNASELPITVVADENKIKIVTKTMGSHRLTVSNTNDTDGIDVLSLANLIGIGDIPADSVGSAYTITGNSLYFYQALFTVYSKQTPESTQITKTATITMNPIEQNTMQKVLNKLNAEFVAQNIDCVASFIITGNLITGIRISTKYKGAGNNVIVKNSTSGSYQPLFAVLNNTNGIEVNNTETVNGNLTGSIEGSVGDGHIDKYVDRLAIAIKKHILNGMPSPIGVVSDAMTVAACPYLNIRNTEGNKYSIDLISQKIGADSIIKIFNFPVLYPTAAINSIVVSGSNKTTSQIVAELNSLLSIYGFSAALNSAGKLVIQANSAGSASGISIISNTSISSNKSSETLLKILGLKDDTSAIDVTEKVFEGTDAKLNLGTFRAKYTGSEGNKIYLVKTSNEDGKRIQVWFKDVLQDTFFNYSLNPNDENYLNNQIANSAYASNIVEYIAPEGSVVEVEDFADGIYYLTGGTSGSVVDEHEYIEALEAYKDIEEFQIDIIVISNLSSPAIISKINEVCSTRKDCFAIIDPPETVAGRINGVAMGGEDDMIRWHNGLKTIDENGTKSAKLDSKYLVTYFPWVLTNTPSIKNPKQWHAPSVEVLKAIINADLMNGDKISPPAGEYTKMTSVEDLAHKIKNKGRLYDDKIGNNINPIVYTSKYGFIIDGQKNTQRDKNKYSRIHVMRIGLYIKRKIFEIAPDFFWKPVTTNTRNDFAIALDTNLMKILFDKGKIKSNYTIKVDEYNDPEIEAENGMIAAIEWSPVGAIEKIKVISTMYEDVVTVTFE